MPRSGLRDQWMSATIMPVAISGTGATTSPNGSITLVEPEPTQAVKGTGGYVVERAHHRDGP